jgi:hypothetical protein
VRHGKRALGSIPLISSPVLIILMALPMSCRRSPSGWQGTIEEIQGTVVVKNPDKPLFPDPVFTLDEELAIGGSDEREQYIFIEMNGVAVDDSGRIYILDRRGSHVKVFEDDGTFLRTIGGSGQGPGEFLNPIAMFLTADRELVIEDFVNRKLSYFTLDGEHLFDRSFRDILGKIVMAPDGNYYAMTTERYIVTGEGVQIGRYLIQKYDEHLNYVSTLDSSTVPDQMDHFMFYFMLQFDIDSKGRIAAGNGQDYALKIFGPEGDLIRTIEKEYAPIPVTPEAVMEQEKSFLFRLKTKLPAHHSAYRSFHWGGDGRLYVRTWEKPRDGHQYIYDVFDTEGRYVAKMPLSIEPWIMKNDKLYARAEDSSGFHILKRYKVNWAKSGSAPTGPPQRTS